MNAIKKYWAIFQITLINSLAYPGELIGRSLMILPFMWIFYQLWKVTFSAAGADTINDMTIYSTMWYLMMAETIELSRPRLANTISDNVKDGSIAYILNKPYNFLLYQFSNSMGETIFRAVMNAILGGLIVWWLVGPPPAPLGWVFAALALFGTWVLNFCISCLIGLSAFLVEEVSPFVWIYQKFVFILGGFLIPLDFYPAWLQSIAKALPFAYMVYGPSKLLVSPSVELFVNILSMQALWIVVLGSILILAYRRGVTHLTVNGG
ncbi:MAG: ABC-2 family transporter protein [Anaerolineales bacterium]|nr:ABC-2 family transporter protein [Anaerolineales bacterium]